MGVLPCGCLTTWEVKQFVDVTWKWTEKYKIGGSDLCDLWDEARTSKDCLLFESTLDLMKLQVFESSDQSSESQIIPTKVLLWAHPAPREINRVLPKFSSDPRRQITLLAAQGWSFTPKLSEQRREGRNYFPIRCVSLGPMRRGALCCIGTAPLPSGLVQVCMLQVHSFHPDSEKCSYLLLWKYERSRKRGRKILTWH